MSWHTLAGVAPRPVEPRVGYRCWERYHWGSLATLTAPPRTLNPIALVFRVSETVLRISPSDKTTQHLAALPRMARRPQAHSPARIAEDIRGVPIIDQCVCALIAQPPHVVRVEAVEPAADVDSTTF